MREALAVVYVLAVQWQRDTALPALLSALTGAAADRVAEDPPMPLAAEPVAPTPMGRAAQIERFARTVGARAVADGGG